MNCILLTHTIGGLGESLRIVLHKSRDARNHGFYFLILFKSIGFLENTALALFILMHSKITISYT